MQYCELRFSGREFTVFVHLALIEALQKEISRASITLGLSEPSGLLLGRGNEGAAIVSSYAPQLGQNFVQDKDQFWKQFASSLQNRAGQLEILGYYRLASEAEPVPDERDLRFLKEFLPESASMLLLIGTSQGSNAGSLFIWREKDRQRLLASKTKLQFPNSSGTEAARRNCIDSPENASRPADESEQSREEQTGAPCMLDIEKPGDRSFPDRSLPAAGKNRFRRMPREAIHTALRSPLVWVLALCIAAIPLWHLISTRRSSPMSSQKSSIQQKAKPLALAARIDNGRLRVTWDATSPLLVSALSAVLSVNPQRGIPDTQVLDRSQLMTGSAVFQLPPAHAKIRLVVFTEEISESPKSDQAIDSQPLAPMTASLTKPDRTAASKENLLPPKGKFKTRNSRTSVASPTAPLDLNRPNRGLKPRTVGFREESWHYRLGSAQGGAESGHMQISEQREPMTVGFREEIWQDRLSTAQRGAESGFTKISEERIPARPIRLIQPDRYHNLYPFTLDSVLIEVRVKINIFGEVMSAEPLSSGNALLGHLSSIAIKAARASTFVPARFGNCNVPSTAVLSYPFLRRE